MKENDKSPHAIVNERTQTRSTSRNVARSTSVSWIQSVKPILSVLPGTNKNTTLRLATLISGPAIEANTRHLINDIQCNVVYLSKPVARTIRHVFKLCVPTESDSISYRLQLTSPLMKRRATQQTKVITTFHTICKMRAAAVQHWFVHIYICEQTVS